jgi:exopolysaccharide biosynthesis polyprenyl glycosylphosphotransferase
MPGVVVQSVQSESLRADAPFVESASPPFVATRRPVIGRGLVLALIDGAILAATLVFAGWASSHVAGPTEPVDGRAALAFAAWLPAWFLVASWHQLYSRDGRRLSHTTVGDMAPLLNALSLGVLLLVASFELLDRPGRGVSFFFIFSAVAIMALPLARGGARLLLGRPAPQKVVVVGAGDVGQTVAEKIVANADWNIDLVGFVDSNPRQRRESLRGVPVLGPTNDLPRVVRERLIDRVIFAFSEDDGASMAAMASELRQRGVRVDLVPQFFETVGPRVEQYMPAGFPLLVAPPRMTSATALRTKRLVDFVGGLALFLVLLPLFLVVAIVVKLESRGPIFFFHERLGVGGRPFRVIKFRTMFDGVEAERRWAEAMQDPALREEFAATHKLRDDPRVTRVGRRLRGLSIDELPQILNVIRGDMSLVGPRPIVADELCRYGKDGDLLLQVRPGMTGYWQVNGRTDVSYEERVRLDRTYVLNWSPRLDFEILGETVRIVLGRKGAY